MTLRLAIRILTLAGASAISGACTGLGGGEFETDAPQLEAVLELDRTSFRIGEPLLATLIVKNVGESKTSIPLPGRASVDFFLRPADEIEPRHLDFVTWAEEGTEFATVAAGEATTRKLLLPTATATGGSFSVFARYRSEGVEAIEEMTTVASNAIQIEVKEPIAFHRDSSGLISADDARSVAARYFGGTSSRVEAQLTRDPRLKYTFWLVTVHFSTPPEGGALSSSCFVDPYLGVVRSLAKVPVGTDSVVDPGWEGLDEDKPSR